MKRILFWVLIALSCLARSYSHAAELVEVYDSVGKPLRTGAIEISPQTAVNSMEKTIIHVHVTLTGSPKEKGELLVRQIGGNDVGAFYGRLVPYQAGQNSIDVDCHLVPNKDRRGVVIVQAFVTSSYKAQTGAVTTELKVNDQP